MASRQALRRAWWQVHKWVGLVLMILLVPLGLSGVVLAWDDAIDHAINPQRYAVSGPLGDLTPSAFVAAATPQFAPGERIAQIRYPQDGGPVVVTALQGRAGVAGRHGHHPDGAKGGGGKHGERNGDGPRAGGGAPPQRAMIWLDPATGRVLDAKHGDTGLIRVAHVFHSNMFVPAYGRALIGLLGMSMFLMAAGGIWLWWPPVGAWIKGLRWRRGDRRLDTNLHHRVGFWIAAPLAFQAFTGVWIAWPQMLIAAGLGHPRPGVGQAMPAEVVVLTPDRALADAQAVKAGQPVSIQWPGRDGSWRVSLKGAGDWLVDDATGTVSPVPRRNEGCLDATMRRLHDGTAIGWGWRALMVAWGLAPTLLAITGLTMWLRGRKWRADAAKRKRATREPVAAA